MVHMCFHRLTSLLFSKSSVVGNIYCRNVNCSQTFFELCFIMKYTLNKIEMHRVDIDVYRNRH